jgi:tetratricopeptide (TPR) repeat protein
MNQHMGSAFADWCAGRKRSGWGLMAFMLCAVLAGCEKNTAQPKIEEARQFLSRDRNQDAIDVLNGVSLAEAAYMRAIALLRLGLEDAAKEQIASALTADSSNPLYQAFDLRTKTLDAKADRNQRAEELLNLCKTRQSEPAFALFAATGHGAKEDAKQAVESFRTAVALAEKIPEFWPEMLSMAISTGCTREAERLLEKMEQANPGDPYLGKQRVLVLIANRKTDEAVRVARAEYERDDQSTDAAMLLAQALRAAAPSAENDAAMEALVQRHPTHVSLVILYGTYLAQTGRLPKALTLLNEAILKLPADKRGLLLPILIGLPLEVGDATAAEGQLTRHRAFLGDAKLSSYYDGRVLLLKKDYGKAAELLAGVAKALKDSKRPDERKMFQESVFWMQKAMFEMQVERRIQSAIDSASNATQPPSPKPATDKPDGSSGPSPSVQEPKPETPASKGSASTPSAGGTPEPAGETSTKP